MRRLASIRPTAGRPLPHRHVVSPTPLATVSGGPAVLQTGGTKLEIGVQGSSARLRPLPPGTRLTHATGGYPIIKLAPPAATERPSASWSSNLRLRRSESVGPAHLQTKQLQHCTKCCTTCTTCTILYNIVHKLYNMRYKRYRTCAGDIFAIKKISHEISLCQ